MAIAGIDEVVGRGADFLKGRRYALVCHLASTDRNGRLSFEILCGRQDTRPDAIWVPEHGLFGEQAYMEAVPDLDDPALGLPVFSLYGESPASLAPSLELLDGLDLVLFDLQDVGSRYYTYLATMAMVMERCASAGVSFTVADRPNPIGCSEVEGNLVQPGLESLVGYVRLANRHGMTAGEVARMHAAENGIDLDLEVLPCKALRRTDHWPDTGLPFVPPSPNINCWAAALTYPGMCLLEGTNVSEGRGTTTPFMVFGAPWIGDPRILAARLDYFALDGVSFLPCWFVPESDKWAGERCGGVRLAITDPRVFRPLLTGLAVVSSLATGFPDDFSLRTKAYEFVADRPALDLLLGNESVRAAVLDGADPRDVALSMEPETREFLEVRERYLLY